MAFGAAAFSKISVLNSPTAHAVSPNPGLWHYVTADTLAVVKAANYFNSEAKQIQVGAYIIADCASGIAWLKVTAVNTVTGVVTVASVGSGKTEASGRQLTVAAVDTVVTGLTTVTSVVASLDSDPLIDPIMVTASIGDQAGAPAAGSIYIKTWKATDGTHPTPIAATVFGKYVNWIAKGT